jgi:hypothetical protein
VFSASDSQQSYRYASPELTAENCDVCFGWLGVVIMRATWYVCMLSLVVADMPATAQSTSELKNPIPRASQPLPKLEAGVRAQIAGWLATCMADWDRASHMTKGEWTIACRRVSAERGKFLREEASKGTLPEAIAKPARRGTRLYQ